MSLQDLIKKKGGQKLDPKETAAKMAILKEIADMASGSMGDDIKGLKKVTVAAPDKEGLEDGLDKAKDLVGQAPQMDDDLGDSDDAESDNDAVGEDDDKGLGDDEQDEDAGKKDEMMLADEIDHETGEGEMSDEEIDELIQLLESKKKKM